MKEKEIRPKKVFEEFLSLAASDVQTFFSNAPRRGINCPACEVVGDLAFSKNGFDYALCPECQTLFVSPRPEADTFSRYYTNAPSVKFWASNFYRVTADARREKLWKPKAQMVWQTLEQCNAVHHHVIDIGGGYGIFAEEMGLLCGKLVTIIEPGPHFSEVCRNRGLKVIEKFLEGVEHADLPEGPKAFTSFELLEHLHDPAGFLRQLHQLMQPGDLFLFTTLSGTGLDILTLWEDSKSVSPPHHLNFLNPKSVIILLERIDFECLSVTTPGKLDLDIMLNNRSKIKDRFWRTFIEHASKETRSRWQEWISDSGWSSHMVICCRKPHK